MQTILRWALRCLATTTLVISLPASAYLQFTYTSQPLPLTSYLVDGWPYDLDEPLPPLAFNLSFTAPEQDLSLNPLTHFVGENFTFNLISPDANAIIYYPIDIKPSSYGHVSLNQEGEVADWNLMLQMTELITPETDMLFYELNDHQIRVTSSSEAGDQLTLRFHPTLWRGYWLQLAQLEITHADTSSGNWTVEKFSVPEPHLAGLLLTGLLVLLRSRQRGLRRIGQG